MNPQTWFASLVTPNAAYGALAARLALGMIGHARDARETSGAATPREAALSNRSRDARTVARFFAAQSASAMMGSSSVRPSRVSL